MARKAQERKDGLELLDEWFPPTEEQRVSREEKYANFEVSMLLQALRGEAGLTQQELADRVGTSRSAIARLEDEQYEGHSLAMLRRIAEALGRRVVVRLEPIEPAEGTGTVREGGRVLEPA